MPQKISELETQKLNRESLLKAEKLCEELSKLNLLPSEFFSDGEDILLLWTKKCDDRKQHLDLIVGEHFKLSYVEFDTNGILFSQYILSQSPVKDIEKIWK